MRTAALLLVILAGCSSGGGGSGAPQPSPLTTCDPNTVRGTYWQHAEVVSGNCGAVPDSLQIIGGPPGCTLVYQRWSHGNCRVDRQVQCGTGNVTGYLVQQTADGSLVTGEESITTLTCAGTYSVTWTRQ
jgi:hypothetical protein